MNYSFISLLRKPLVYLTSGRFIRGCPYSVEVGLLLRRMEMQKSASAECHRKGRLLHVPADNLAEVPTDAGAQAGNKRYHSEEQRAPLLLLFNYYSVLTIITPGSLLIKSSTALFREIFDFDSAVIIILYPCFPRAG